MDFAEREAEAIPITSLFCTMLTPSSLANLFDIKLLSVLPLSMSAWALYLPCSSTSVHTLNGGVVPAIMSECDLALAVQRWTESQ